MTCGFFLASLIRILLNYRYSQGMTSPAAAAILDGMPDPTDLRVQAHRGTTYVMAGPVVPPLIDQWQRVRIVGKVLDKVDSVDDAVSLLQALASASWPAADASAGSAQKP